MDKVVALVIFYPGRRLGSGIVLGLGLPPRVQVRRVEDNSFVKERSPNGWYACTNAEERAAALNGCAQYLTDLMTQLGYTIVPAPESWFAE